MNKNTLKIMALELSFQRFWSNTNSQSFTTALLEVHEVTLHGNNASVRVLALVRRKWAWFWLVVR